MHLSSTNGTKRVALVVAGALIAALLTAACSSTRRATAGSAGVRPTASVETPKPAVAAASPAPTAAPGSTTTKSAAAATSAESDLAAPGSAVAKIQEEARSMAPLVSAPWVRDFLAATDALPAIAPRTVYHDAEKTRYYSDAEAARLSSEERATLTPRTLDERFYYNTRYGTPIAYARPLDILAASGFQAPGRKILDFGYGGIGQLRLLASLGAQVCGVEIDPLTRALYSGAGDQGAVKGRTGGGGGALKVVHGRFPADETVRSAVGSGYDLVISKNTLKHGYIHPDEPVPDRQRVILGVSDEEFLRTLFSILEPGGRVLLYNLSPAPSASGKPYKPWADGRSPFPVPLYEAAGFRVVAFDRDDSREARAMGHALGWDAGESPMDLENDLFALYTLLEKPARPAQQRESIESAAPVRALHRPPLTVEGDPVVRRARMDRVSSFPEGSRCRGARRSR